MPEVTIKYTSPKTLEALKAIAKYLDFVVSKPRKEPTQKTDDASNSFSVNGVTIVRGDSTIDLSEMSDVFTGKSIDSKKLRTTAWQRNK